MAGRLFAPRNFDDRMKSKDGCVDAYFKTLIGCTVLLGRLNLFIIKLSYIGIVYKDASGS